jgi:TolB-like protein
MAKAQNKKIAVLPFPYTNGDISSGSSIVAERLTTQLAQRPEVQVIERSLLSKVLGEIKLEESGVIDPASMHQVGHVLGVGAVVTGTLIDLENQKTEVNARLIDAESGAVLSAATERIDRTWTDLPRPAPADHTASPASAFRSPPSGGVTDPPSEVPSRNEDVLTLTNKDLEHTEPLSGSADNLVASIMHHTGAAPAHPFAVLRRIYNRNPDYHIRAAALFDIGLLLEQLGRPRLAARAYHQLLQEFPRQPRLDLAASARLQALGL